MKVISRLLKADKIKFLTVNYGIGFCGDAVGRIILISCLYDRILTQKSFFTTPKYLNRILYLLKIPII